MSFLQSTIFQSKHKLDAKDSIFIDTIGIFKKINIQ